jgi:hypothetical protein
MPKPIVFHVSPAGNDRWSGTRPKPNAAATDGPFATITRARDALRALRRKGLAAPAKVLIRAGTYFLSEPLVFDHRDSGTADCPVTFASYPGERPLISGGVPITGWHPTQVNGKPAWIASLPNIRPDTWQFMQLFVNGGRRFRPRLPKTGWHYFASLLDIDESVTWNVGQHRANFQPGHMSATWRNLTDVEVVGLHLWSESRLPIASIDSRKRIVNFAKTSVFRLADDFALRPGRYYIDNVFEALEDPGQWYLDPPAGRLYYIPHRTEKPDKVEAFVPRLEQLVRVLGSPDGKRPVEHLNFRGLTFSHAEWRLPPDQSGTGQAEIIVPGALFFQGARNCSVTECEVSHVGGYGIEFADGCRDVAVSRCRITDLGAGGVKIGHHASEARITDCEISDGAHIYHSAVGVWIGDTGPNLVAHNDIHHFYYTGVSVGWVWGYGPSRCVGNVVEHNHIHHLGQGLLSDMGGIYTLSIQPGGKLRNNLIHDVDSYSYGGWGIYPDEGTSNLLIENNVVFRTKTGGFHQHYGRDNLVRTNIFAFAREGQIQRSRVEDHTSFIFERNIVFWKDGPLLHGGWDRVQARFDRNIYWRTDHKPVDFAGRRLAEWNALGQDRHSIIADPNFAAPAKPDFSLKPASPALKLGFKPIDISKVGPRRPPGPR